MSEQELVVIEETTVLAAFTSEDGLDAIVEEVRAIVIGFEHDMKTAGSRAKTATLAAKIPKLKTKLDGLGKDLVADWKSKSKVVDNSRKKMRDELDELKVIARSPLTEWEEKAKNDAAEKLAAEKAAELKREVGNAWDLAEMMNEKIDKDIAELIRLAAETKAAEESRIKAEAEAAEAGRIEAARVAEQEKAAQAIAEAKEREEAAEAARVQAEQDSKNAAVKAEADKKAAEELAASTAIAVAAQAEQRRVREAQEAKDREAAAVQAEKDRQAAQVESDRLAQEKLEANKAHVGRIRKAAKESLMIAIRNIDEDTAKAIVIAISKGEIENVSINY